MKLYLDVDGVINASNPKWGRVEKQHVLGYRITWSPTMLMELGGLDLDLVWLTTWGEDAPNSLGPVIGFGWDAPAPVAVPSTWNWSTIEWKLAGLQGLDPGNRFVWIDDDLRDDDYSVWGSRARSEYPDALLINPDPRVGITPDHISQIRSYING